MSRKFAAGCLSLLLGAASVACSHPTPSETPTMSKRGPNGGYMMAYPYMDLSVEAVITPDGLIRVYGYDQAGNQADLMQYYPRNLTAIRVDYYPDGALTVELGTDSERGCLMAKIDMPRAREIGRAPNVIITLL